MWHESQGSVHSLVARPVQQIQNGEISSLSARTSASKSNFAQVLAPKSAKLGFDGCWVELYLNVPFGGPFRSC